MAGPSQGRGYRQPLGKQTQSGSLRHSRDSHDFPLGTTDARCMGKSVGPVEGFGSRCWPGPEHQSEAAVQESLAGPQWCIWDALCSEADLRKHGRGEIQARLLCSSRLRPLLAPPIGSYFPKDVVPPWFDVSLLHGASEDFPNGQGAVGGMSSPRQTGARVC